MLAVGAGEMVLDGGKAKCPGVFVEVLRERQRILEVDNSTVDKVQ